MTLEQEVAYFVHEIQLTNALMSILFSLHNEMCHSSTIDTEFTDYVTIFLPKNNILQIQ